MIATSGEFIEKLDSLFAARQYDKVEPFMLATLKEAKEREDYGLYLSVGNEMIGYYRSVSRFKKAYEVSEDMLLLMEELQMDQSVEFATVLLNTATAYSFDENFEMALQFYRRAEQIYRLLVPPEDYLFAGLYNNMSSLMEKMGRNEEALSLLMKALGILRHYPDRQMEAATNFTNLGLLYLKTGDYESGKKCVTQAVTMFEALQEPASHYSAALSALAEIYYREKDFVQAAEWYQKTLAEIEKHYGRNLAYAVICENLANVCRESGDRGQAEEWYDRAKKVRADLERENGRGSIEAARNPDSMEVSGENVQNSGSIENSNAGTMKNTDSAEDDSAGKAQNRKYTENSGEEKVQGDRCAEDSNVRKEQNTESAESGSMEKVRKIETAGKGLERCRAYYERYGRSMLAQFPELQGHFAAGLVGEGSECFGYDDAISTDHDYFPRFFIWLDDEAYEKYGEALQAAYEKLPRLWSSCLLGGETEGGQDVCMSDGEAETVMTPAAAERCGVCRTKDFYYRLLGRETPPENLYDWISLQETRLATVTNGAVFEDCGGGFRAQRDIYLSGFPEDVRRKK